MNRDRTGALFILVIGFLYIWQISAMPSATIGDPLGHRAFPCLLAGLMVFLGGSLLLRPATQSRSVSAGKLIGSVLPLCLLLGGYGAKLPWVGYPVGNFLFLAAATRLIGEKSWPLTVFLSAGISAAIYALFTQILSIPLPLGFLDGLKGS